MTTNAEQEEIRAALGVEKIKRNTSPLVMYQVRARREACTPSVLDLHHATSIPTTTILRLIRHRRGTSEQAAVDTALSMKERIKGTVTQEDGGVRATPEEALYVIRLANQKVRRKQLTTAAIAQRLGLSRYLVRPALVALVEAGTLTATRSSRPFCDFRFEHADADQIETAVRGWLETASGKRVQSAARPSARPHAHPRVTAAKPKVRIASTSSSATASVPERTGSLKQRLNVSGVSSRPRSPAKRATSRRTRGSK